MERCHVSPSKAERLAEYARLRADGTDEYDVIPTLGISLETARRYERWLAAFRHELGLPRLHARPPRPRLDADYRRRAM